MTTYRLSISIPWDPRRAQALLDLAHDADAAGVETLWVNEGFGHDAISGLTLLAWETERVRLGSSIVNSYSRTPGTLAQSFATLDQLSNGRAIIGLGTSGPGVIERFHGLPYDRPLARLRETVELLRAYWRGERIDHEGEVFTLRRGLPLGAEPVQPSPPIYLATLHPASVRLTAELADGWLPAWIPLDRLAGEVARLRAWAEAAGRHPAALTVRAPGAVLVVPDAAERERVRQARAEQLAFFVARNGDFYHRQFLRHGLEAEAAAIRHAWDTGGREAAVALITPALLARFDLVVADAAEARDRLAEQAHAGADLHQVSVLEPDRARRVALLEALAG